MLAISGLLPEQHSQGVLSHTCMLADASVSAVHAGDPRAPAPGQHSWVGRAERRCRLQIWGAAGESTQALCLENAPGVPVARARTHTHTHTHITHTCAQTRTHETCTCQRSRPHARMTSCSSGSACAPADAVLQGVFQLRPGLVPLWEGGRPAAGQAPI